MLKVLYIPHTSCRCTHQSAPEHPRAPQSAPERPRAPKSAPDRPTREGLDAINDILGDQLGKMTAADQLSNLVAVQARIHEYEICKHQKDAFDQNWDGLSDTLKAVIKRARQISSDEYADAIAVKLSAQDFFADFFTEFDAIIAPSAIG